MIDDKRMKGIIFSKVEIQQPIMIAFGIDLLQLADEPFQRHVCTTDTSQPSLAVDKRHGERTDVVFSSYFIEIGICPKTVFFVLCTDIPVCFQVVVTRRTNIPCVLLITTHIGLKPLLVLRKIARLESHVVTFDIIVQLDLFLHGRYDRLWRIQVIPDFIEHIPGTDFLME